MRILIIGPFPDPINGCSLANQVLARNLRDYGHEVDYINTSGSAISSRQGSRFSGTKALRFLSKYLLSFKVFLASAIYITPGQTYFGFLKYAPFMLFALCARKPYVLHIHGNHFGKHYRALGRWRRKIFKFFAASSSAGIVLSGSLTDNFDQLLPSTDVFAVENFAENYLFQGEHVKDTKLLRPIYLSNLMEGKGILDFLDSLLILRDRGIEFRAAIAGQLETAISNIVTEKLNALGTSVVFHGTVTGDKKKNLLDASNVLLLPTFYEMEGQPICLLEGLATGNIIITTRHAGIPDVVSTRNGFFVPPRNPVELANTLEKISYSLEECVHQFSGHNIRYAKSRFTEEIFSKKIIKILLSVTNTSTHHE